MQRYFWHLVTATFLSFGLVHFFLDQTLVGPVGLLALAGLNTGVYFVQKKFTPLMVPAAYVSMMLLMLAILWYLPANNSGSQSPAIMVAIIFPGVVYYLLGIKHGVVWAFCIFVAYTLFISGGDVFLSTVVPVWPTINPGRVLADYWIVFSMMLMIAFGMSHLIVRQRDQLDRQVRMDPLTKILNRRGLQDTLQHEFDKSQRYHNHLSLFIIDADHFKKVNDQHGHNVGDRVLVALAEVLKTKLRKVDAVGRWGGEEFLALLPMTSLANAKIAAEKVRVAVEQMVVLNDQNARVPVTVSIGVCAIQKSDAGLDAFIKRADDALYSAKNDGRNRVSIA